MKTRNLGIVVDQGADFALTIGIFKPCPSIPLPVDISTYAFLGEIRDNTGPSSVVIAEFVFTILNQGTNPGQVVMSLTNEITSALDTTTINGEEPCRKRTPYVFDVKMKDDNGLISRIIQGIAEVSPQATMEDFS